MIAFGSVLCRLRPLIAAAAISFSLALPGHAETVTPLVSAGWLAQHLAEPSVLVLDVRVGAEVFSSGHIPGCRRSPSSRS